MISAIHQNRKNRLCDDLEAQHVSCLVGVWGRQKMFYELLAELE